MAPRQLIRNSEVRAPDVVDDTRTNQQVRTYRDAPGADRPPQLGDDLEQFFSYVLSRLRLNAGALDWRQPPTSSGAGGTSYEVVGEAPEGAFDGQNQAFITHRFFVPQSLKVSFNGLRQRFGPQSDYTLQESAGQGTGYNTILLAYAPLAGDELLIDYLPSQPAEELSP